MNDVASGVTLDGAVGQSQGLLVAEEEALARLPVLHDVRLAVGVRRDHSVAFAIVVNLWERERHNDGSMRKARDLLLFLLVTHTHVISKKKFRPEMEKKGNCITHRHTTEMALGVTTEETIL